MGKRWSVRVGTVTLFLAVAAMGGLALGALAAPEVAAAPAIEAVPVTAPASAAKAGSGITVTASVGGKPLAGSDGSHPVRLVPGPGETLALHMVNNGSVAVTARTVRLSGSVMGLPFFSYDTDVNLAVPAHGSADLHFAIDLSGLGGQATGLMPGGISVLGAGHRQLASEAGVVDVRGSLVSVYGLFGLAVLIFTIGALAGALVALSRHHLPTNRWRRAIRFLVPGIGIGLVAIFTLSAFRVFVPRTSHWIMLLVIPSVVLFVFGYLTPTPVEDGDEGDEGDEEDDEDDEGDEGDEGDGGAEAPSTPHVAAQVQVVPDLQGLRAPSTISMVEPPRSESGPEVRQP